MTDAAIAADSGAAPVDVRGAPINESPAGFTQPLGSQIPPDAQADAQTPKPASLDDSIDRAIAKSAEKEAAKGPAEKIAKAEPAKVDPARGEGGKFAPKEAAKPADAAAPEPAQRVSPAEPAKVALPSHTASEAPARFSPDAKTEWATAPESVRRETERAIKELTDGFAKHKQSAEAYEGYRELDGIAQQHGKRGSDVFKEYYETEKHLQRDLVGGLDAICQKMGVSLKDVAAHVLNQPADQQTSQSDATIRELKAELAQIKQQVGSVTQTFQQQQQTAVGKEVTDFASDPAHSRFEELSEDIAFFLKTRCPGDLKQAYELAERLNPALKSEAAPIQVASSAAPSPEVHPSKGQKSINGAPSSASSAAGRKRVAKSLDDALDSAFASAG